MSQIFRESIQKFETVTLDYEIPVWKEGSNNDGTLKRITLKDFFASDLISTVLDPPNWATSGLSVTGSHTHDLQSNTVTLEDGTHIFAASLVFRALGNIFMPNVPQNNALTKLAVFDSGTGQVHWRDSSTLSGNYFDKTSDDTDDISEGVNKFTTAANLTKLGHIGVSQAVDLDQMESDIAVNNLKVSNVSTNIVIGAPTATTNSIGSSDGTSGTLSGATSVYAGLLTAAKFNEIGANTLKVSNQPTDLSEGTSTATTVDVNSSDGTNATLAAASTLRAGLMSKAKFDEVVVNNAKTTNANHTGEVTGSGALTIADDVVDEANLKVSNAPTNGHALIARSGETGGLKWEAISATVANGSVTNAKLADVATLTIKGREAAGTGSPQDLSLATVRTMLNVEDGADVTDTTNVTAAGALMDSELTDLAGVKGVTISTLQVKPAEGAFADGDKTKLDGIETGATADQTDSEIETAYNAQVAVATQAEAEAGTLTDVKRWTPQRVKQAIDALAGGTPALNNGQIFVGNASNAATSVAMSGDVAISNTGATTIQADAVTYSKMQDVSQPCMLGKTSAGVGQVTEVPLIDQYLSAGSVATLLETTSNWDVNGNYTGSTITGTYQGQAHYDANYWFTAVADNTWIRLIRG